LPRISRLDPLLVEPSAPAGLGADALPRTDARRANQLGTTDGLPADGNTDQSKVELT